MLDQASKWVRFDMHWVTCPRETTELQEHKNAAFTRRGAISHCSKWQSFRRQTVYTYEVEGQVATRTQEDSTHNKGCYIAGNGRHTVCVRDGVWFAAGD